MERTNRIICLGGPTGCGKTKTAIAIAQELGCEIINADSRQVYADFPIITAQPEGIELQKAPHHLYGFLDTSQKIDVGLWLNLAWDKIREIRQRGNIPLLTGGTGFYFQAILYGLAPIPPIKPAIRELYAMRMAAEGSERLYAELRQIDAGYAMKIHPHDRQRIQRALEVYASTGITFSQWHRTSTTIPAYAGQLYIMDISLKELEPLLNRRIELMLEMGAIAEVEMALSHCDLEDAPGWSGIGCRELRDYLQGKNSWQECLEQWRANTRAYAKRQLTWFKKREATHIGKEDDLEEIIKIIKKDLER